MARSRLLDCAVHGRQVCRPSLSARSVWSVWHWRRPIERIVMSALSTAGDAAASWITTSEQFWR
ncbi:MAG: hypothetical protein ABT15_23950 [Pseudonocardia sp. SCN 73-27]|nr:MAG: hypothetical protein ABS80_00720 [Pseudonocardia sp. SCN 72-51]ODV03085.1 MAG: hypothetical protein ABT15_23950 [Pseudonocardia sp. SCN 73-27]